MQVSRRTFSLDAPLVQQPLAPTLPTSMQIMPFDAPGPSSATFVYSDFVQSAQRSILSVEPHERVVKPKSQQKVPVEFDIHHEATSLFIEQHSGILQKKDCGGGVGCQVHTQKEGVLNTMRHGGTSVDEGGFR